MIDESYKNSFLPKDARFSIIIPSWNNLDYLKNCVDSLRKHSAFSHDIIIHINEGKDGTLEWVRSQNDLSYCYSSRNIGICYALNLARKLIQTDYLLYMNDDMYAAPDWDIPLWHAIQEEGKNRLFFFSATQMQPGSFWDSGVLDQSNYGTTLEEFDEKQFLEEHNDRHMDDWSGATWPPNVVHKSVWDAVGGYSVEFSPGLYSDPDFSMKLWKLGVRKFRGIAESRVYHFESISTKRNSMNAGSIQFLMKWGMTAGTFVRYYLKRGAPYEGPLTTPRHDLNLRTKLLLGKIKKIYYSIIGR